MVLGRDHRPIEGGLVAAKAFCTEKRTEEFQPGGILGRDLEIELNEPARVGMRRIENPYKRSGDHHRSLQAVDDRGAHRVPPRAGRCAVPPGNNQCCDR